MPRATLDMRDFLGKVKLFSILPDLPGGRMALRQQHNASFITAPHTDKSSHSHLTAHCCRISGESLISLGQSAFRNYFWYTVLLHMNMHIALWCMHTFISLHIYFRDMVQRSGENAFAGLMLLPPSINLNRLTYSTHSQEFTHPLEPFTRDLNRTCGRH